MVDPNIQRLIAAARLLLPVLDEVDVMPLDEKILGFSRLDHEH
jgi:hypothetical protein